MAVGQLVRLAETVTLASSNSAAVTVPNDGSVVVGDLLLAACVMPSGSRTFAISGGAGGWTSLGTASQAGHMSQVWWRITAAGDLGATITVTPSPGGIRQVLLLGKVSGAQASSPVTATSNTSASAATKTTPSLGSVSAGSREISIVWDSRGAATPQTSLWTSPAGQTRQAQAFTTAGSGASSGAWGDSDSTVSGTIGSRIWAADVAALGSAWTLAVASSEQTASPTVIASTATLPTPNVAPGPVTAAPARIDSTAVVPSAAVAPGAVTVAPTVIAPTATIGTPTAEPGPVTITPLMVDSTLELSTANVQPGPVAVQPAPIASRAELYTPAVDLGPAIVTPTRLGPSTSTGTLTVTPGPVTISPARIAPAAIIRQPQVNADSELDSLTAGTPDTRWHAHGVRSTRWTAGRPRT